MPSGHGGNLNALARQSGLDRRQILDFSASINPLGPPDGLRPALAAAVDRLVDYPDPDCSELVAALAQRHGVAAEQVVVGNGSSELLFAVARAGGYRRGVIPVPCYLDYAAAVEATGREVFFHRLGEEHDFALDSHALDAVLRPEDLVFLGQPNNPTGRIFDANQFCTLAGRHAETTFVVDEAFAPFVAGYRTLIGRVPDNVIVVRSLTKFYAIPGLRLGYLVALPDRARQIRRQLAPWSVNTLAQEAGLVLLADDDYARRTVTLVRQERERLTAELDALPGAHVYPGEANYLLVRISHGDFDAPCLAERLLRQGLAIRTFGPGEHLDRRFFRLAVRSAEENDRLCAALAAAFGAARPSRRKRKTPALMIQGTSSNAGKSVLVAALCRILFQDGIDVAPFKSQNMSLNSFVTRDGGEMGRAQVVQAQACRREPDTRMNPILLKPSSDTGCQVIVRGQPVANMRVAEYVRYKPQAFDIARACYDSLAAECSAIVLEGAGSPGEMNLKSHDIVNMRMAEYAQSPVVIVGDIDRGGVFASIVGTMEVLAPWERRQVAGWIVNRFRGDESLLGPALDYVDRHTGRPVLGVVPFLPDLNLPQEDSVDFKSGVSDRYAGPQAVVEIAIIDLPHISNFTDFDAFRVEPDVCLRIVRSADDLGQPDAVMLPGSKNTLGDLDRLRRSGLADRIRTLASHGRTEIVGICGGLQMLGHEILDPLGIESAAAQAEGLRLLPFSTVLAAEKTLVRTRALHISSGLDVQGYEIHHGRTPLGDCRPLVVRPDGQVVAQADHDERVWGTYLHGLFDADPFRRWFIDRLRVRRGLPALGTVVGHYDLESALDRLAAVVRGRLPIKKIYQLMGL
jgi:cobyric acid synthase CobQ/L-threonine-O-3-phosphate decarboxylase